MTAFWTDPAWVLMWRAKPLDYVIQQASLRGPKNLLLDRTNRRHQKAVDSESGAIVGYARWVLPTDTAGAEQCWSEARVPAVSAELQDEAERQYEAADWSFDHSLDELDDPITEMKERHLKGRNYFLLDFLAVPPENRRQGIGTALVESGVREAERLGLDIFVHSKEAGLGVYGRLGFRRLEHVVLDDSKFGGNGKYGAYFLLKEVKKRSDSE